MLLKFRNRKPSSDSKSTTRRNRPRRIRFESLQDRQLMAADFGGFADFYGPQLPNAENTAAEMATTTSSATTANSNAATTEGFYHVSITPNNNGGITLNGTVFNDVVNITQQGTQVTITTTTSYNGEQIGSSEQTFQRHEITGITFFGSHGNDTFVNDTDIATWAWGESGHDRLVAQKTASAYLDGGDHNDTIIGGNGGDTLDGGDGHDLIYGYGGDDVIFGRDGNDTIYAGDGDDTVYGEDGLDKIYGGEGDDYLRGGDDNDRIYGQNGHDTMFGDRGDDVLFGFAGNDTMLGGAGSDSLYGSSGNDSMDGGSGNDLLSGGSGRDELFGRTGMDSLFGGSDRDLLDGGDDNVNDQLFGGTGNDIFIRHKHVWSADDPDEFRDFSAAQADEVFNDWFSPNYGNDFPV